MNFVALTRISAPIQTVEDIALSESCSEPLLC